MNTKVSEKVIHDLDEIRALLREIKVEDISDDAAQNLARCWEMVTGIQQQLSTQEPSLAEEKSTKVDPVARALPVIAIIDDDPDVQKMLTFTLKRKGFEVHSFYDPKEALDRIIGTRPDVILLDLMMPNMTGFEFLQHFKSMRSQLPSVRIIVGSARSFESDRLAVLKSGANDFVAKPYSLDELVLRINNLIAA